ncbi:MAG: AAA family ATPase [Bacteroidetes bacterium]|nr:AAA family ATPase [Bacteroidota bacterium]
MNELIDIFERQIAATDITFVRSVISTINWNARLIGIRGARGIGKTTLLLQYIKINLTNELNKVLYVSLDNVWFNNNRLIDLAITFEKSGGKYLFLDEVHKYPNWSQEIKNIYDTLPSLKVVFTGSSLLEILNSRADLSRRAVVYEMKGLSFREYLSIETGVELNTVSLNDILENSSDVSRDILKEIKPFQYFEAYLKFGYYPFYKEEKELYYLRLGEVVNLMLEIELPMLRKVEVAYIPKIKQLLSIIASAVPFIPNVSKLSQKIDINRNTLLSYFHYLDEIGLTQNLFKENTGISLLQKPMKVFLENTNLMYLLAKENTNTGNLRETFFANQVSYQNSINFIEQTDFLVNEKFKFEIGGKNKMNEQIKDLEDSFLVLDNIEIGRDRTIPLWLFGFLY